MFKQPLVIIGKSHIRALALVALGLLLFSTVAIYLVEHSVNEQLQTFGDCLWWAMVTMSTVGYGDKVPTTVVGQIVAAITMLTGPVLLVTLVSSAGLSMYEERRKAVCGELKIESKNHIILCGWNPKARDIITELRLSAEFHKYPITIIDDQIDENPIDEGNVSFVHGDACEVSVLEQANIREAKFAIVIASDGTSAADRKTVLTILAVETLNPSILSCAELNDPANEGHLRRAGCDVVINTTILTSKLLAMSIEDHTIGKVITELVTHAQGNEICRLQLPSNYQGKPFQELFEQLKRVHNVIVIGVERKGECSINPTPDFALEAGDFLMVISGKNSFVR